MSDTAFSNGFEFDAWEPNWCGSCTKDYLGYAADDVFCPILSQVMIDNEVPPQWSPGTDDLRDRYHCSEFEGGGGRGDDKSIPRPIIDLDTAAVLSPQ